MFFQKEKRIAALEAENLALTARQQTLDAELVELRLLLAEQQALAQAKDSECETLKAVLRNLALFSGTLSGSQQSLAAMATRLREEKARALEAAHVSMTSGQASTEIASSLHVLAQNSVTTAKEVDGLAQQAGEISAIKSLRVRREVVSARSTSAAVLARICMPISSHSSSCHLSRKLSDFLSTPSRPPPSQGGGVNPPPRPPTSQEGGVDTPSPGKGRVGVGPLAC